MAIKYCYSAAAGTGTGASWVNAYTTLALAFAGMAAGDTVYVAHDHAETQASAMTCTSPGTSASPCSVICVDRGGTVPPVSADLRTTATITTTGAFGITIAGVTFYYGITFAAGTGATTAGFSVGNSTITTFKNCSIQKLGTTASTSAITLTSSTAASLTILDNTTVKFGATGDRLVLRGIVRWINTASPLASGSAAVTGLLAVSVSGFLYFLGMDLSGLVAIYTTTNMTASALLVLEDCKLPSGFAGGAPNVRGMDIVLIRCDDADTNYVSEKHRFEGAETTETTIVRTGGASDGTQAQSRKIVTNANCKFLWPFECLPFAVWNEITGANVTVTVYGIWGGGAVPLNDEIWIEATYIGDASFPIASRKSSAKADILATGASVDTDASTWGGSTTKFKLVVTLTSPQPQEKGLINVQVKVGKASSTFYIDPKAVLS